MALRRLRNRSTAAGDELRCSEAGDEVASADAAAFFEGFEDRVDSGKAAGNIFGCGAFAEEDAVAVKELEGQSVGGFGGGGEYGPQGLRPLLFVVR